MLVTTFAPVSPSRAADVYILYLGALILVLLVRATRAASPTSDPSVYERALVRRRPVAARPRDLARLEREVVLAATTAFDAHMRLRPHLREIAAHRLESRRGLDLDRGGPLVRELLGDELWRFVRPGVEPPDDRFAPGMNLRELRVALDTLERL